MSLQKRTNPEYSQHPRSSSTILLVGLSVVAAAYFGFVRPAQQHLLSLERQCNKLVIAVKKLQSKDETARHGLRLIKLLEAQNEKMADAENALGRFAELRQRIVQESEEVTGAIAALEQLETVQSDMLRFSQSLANTATSLEEMVDLAANISASVTASGETARETNGSLAQLGEQQLGLADGITQLSQQLSSLESAVANRSQNLPQAEQVLAKIDQLCEKLAFEVQDLSAAQAQLSKLSGLKDEVLVQSTDIPAAEAALDQVWDLKAGLVQAGNTISQARQLTVDMMLLEPVLERVAKSLQPMTDATRLSRREAAKSAPKTRETASIGAADSPWSHALNKFVALLSEKQ